MDIKMDKYKLNRSIDRDYVGRVLDGEIVRVKGLCNVDGDREKE